MQQANQTIFKNLKNFIQNKLRDIVPTVLQHQKYDPNKTKQFVNQISQQILNQLSNINKNFKYIINCTLQPSPGNGLDMVNLFYWDNQMDGVVTYKWEGKHLICIVNVYGIALA